MRSGADGEHFPGLQADVIRSGADGEHLTWQALGWSSGLVELSMFSLGKNKPCPAGAAL